ncbi:hypothetical protein KSS87_003722 [Heliosperma pusillum]|nr:hypothetical protein KSS87_003722 [Heliosperma pusillum]
MTIGSYEDDACASSSVSLEYRNKQEVTESPQKKKAKIESKRKLDKKESKRKLKEWFETNCALTGLLDTTGACILEVDGRKLKQSKPDIFSRLRAVLWSCRFKRCLAYFTHPGGEDSDGGMGAIENCAGLISREDKQHYANISRIAIEQYNKNMNNQQSSKLEFYSFIRVAFTFGFHLYITFTACQNGQLGIYQAVVDDDWHEEGNIYLVLLRHLDADKIIAIMSLSGAEEEWERLFGKNWKLCGVSLMTLQDLWVEEGKRRNFVKVAPLREWGVGGILANHQAAGGPARTHPCVSGVVVNKMVQGGEPVVATGPNPRPY